jgi:murein DD-endopeptidase MepM/ murein hydrolase activator NlpD
MIRWLAVIVLFALLVVAGLFVAAGRGAVPSLSIDKPERAIGQQSELQVTAGAPGGRLSSLTITLEQNGASTPLFTLDTPQAATVSQTDSEHLQITRAVGKVSVPQLQPGAARITVAATRRSWLGLRTLSSTMSKDVLVRLEPPRVGVLSTHHFVNQGGSEMVLYRATPAETVSGVRVGDIEYPGFPAAGAGTSSTGTGDPAVKVAFFALLADQDLKTPITLFARDDAGNEAKATFVDRVFPKVFKKSRIEVDDRFFERVVPDILANSPDLKIESPTGDLLPAFLRINGELRQMNADRIVELTKATSPSLLIKGPFKQLGNSQVEAGFADHRTYLHDGKEVDQQVHLGFDLAVTARVPVLAANDGKVLNASWLGIYGNCVILDHGMGLATLYGHLSSLDVKVGDTVTIGQVLGRSGTTGLAGGDHLHFTMLVSGHPVNPVDWWDPHWIQDRITRKLSDAGTSPAVTP